FTLDAESTVMLTTSPSYQTKSDMMLANSPKFPADASVHDYDLYVFDNAFTSIDSASKRIIKENIKKRLENKTVIFIDNDFEDNSYFDDILVMDNGKIISQGKHDELIKTCDTYKKLFNESRGCNDGK
ncbi:MAG: hypothetical protein IKF13_00915, partial [Methanobrevibacter sp.]|nr:hypothetical protein [Methanobrevibacter sp.]